ncbi:hypothetical protein J7643_15280 [bacterium]|nr:hypothetical protein [bacterium]
MRRALLAAGCAALLVGCQVRGLPPLHVLPTSAARDVASSLARSEVAIVIRWPLRAQAIPTNTQRLRFDLTGPVTQTVLIDRPPGAAPVSEATMSVDVGAGYSLSVKAYAASEMPGAEPDRLVAQGQTTEPFEVLANQVARVKVALVPTDVPRITAIAGDHGGPGSYLEISCLTAEPLPSFRFGGVVSAQVSRLDEGRFSVRVPEGAGSGAIVPIAAGVEGDAFGYFTVLSEIGIEPATKTVSLGAGWPFTAEATSAEGVPFVAPQVYWELSTDSIGVIDPASGSFLANGGTGSAEVRIYAGRLMASASITVTE